MFMRVLRPRHFVKAIHRAKLDTHLTTSASFWMYDGYERGLLLFLGSRGNDWRGFLWRRGRFGHSCIDGYSYYSYLPKSVSNIQKDASFVKKVRRKSLALARLFSHRTRRIGA